MELLWQKITEWLKQVLISGITDNLTGMFDATNQKVAEISAQVGIENTNRIFHTLWLAPKTLKLKLLFYRRNCKSHE